MTRALRRVWRGGTLAAGIGGHDWITEWKQDHWSDEQEAEFNKEFCEKWQSDHGTPFPGAAPTTEQPLITTDDLRRLQEEAEAASDGPA